MFALHAIIIVMQQFLTKQKISHLSTNKLKLKPSEYGDVKLERLPFPESFLSNVSHFTAFF